MLIKFGAVIVFSPIFTLPGIAAFLIGGLAGQMYIKAQLSVKREMSNARSPVLSHFGAAIAGISALSHRRWLVFCADDPTVSIRAYAAQDMFKQESLDRIDKFSRPARTFYNLNRWISIRIDTIGALFSSGLAAYLVYGTGAIHRPGYAAAIGFSLNMAVGFSSMILWWVRILNEFEVSGNRWAFLNKLARVFLNLSPVWNASRTTLISNKSRKLRLTVFPPLTGQPAERWS